MSDPEEKQKPTLGALRGCAEWLKACLEMGWQRSDLDFLEELWWKHHDQVGKLRGRDE